MAAKSSSSTTVPRKEETPATSAKDESDAENMDKDAELADETKQLSWIRITQDSVRSKLRDPSSAKFKDVRFHAYKGQTPMVCGKVNSKNAFGGFVGYQHFIGSGSKFAFLETEFKGNEFAKTWNELCLK